MTQDLAAKSSTTYLLNVVETRITIFLIVSLGYSSQKNGLDWISGLIFCKISIRIIMNFNECSLHLICLISIQETPDFILGLQFISFSRLKYNLSILFTSTWLSSLGCTLFQCLLDYINRYFFSSDTKIFFHYCIQQN